MGEASLQIRLMGTLELTWNDAPLVVPSSLKVRSLLAYLILHHDHFIARIRLSGLFWPERPDDRARRALSQALWQIRSALGSADDRLVTERDTVTFEIRPGDWLDVEAFEEKVSKYASGKWQADDTSSAHASSTHLLELSVAADLYRADFLENVYDDWALLERERLRELYLSALQQLTTLHKQQGSYEQSLIYAQRLSAADPLREEAHRELMQLYHLLGRSQAALEQFITLRDLLARELGAQPTPATVTLYHEIADALADVDVSHLPVAPPPPPLLHDLSRLPFVGRTSERATLLSAMQAAVQGRGGCALVEGDAGVGKTRLVGEVIAGAEWRGFQVGAAKAKGLAALAPYQLLCDALLPLLTPLRIAQLANLVEPMWLSAVTPVLTVIAEHLPDLPALISLDHREEQRRLLGGLAQCLAGLASIAPLLLALEDVHWADEATLAALAYLIHALSTDRVFFILSCRTAEARERAIVWETLDDLDRARPLLRVHLGPFELADTEDLLGRALGTGEADTQTALLAERLQGETGGNALFLVESLRTLLEQQALTRSSDGRWVLSHERLASSIAASIQEIVDERLSRLESAMRGVLELAAVLGEDADFPVLIRAGDGSPTALLSALAELKRYGFLIETEARYRFEHERVREITYQAVALERRRWLHCRVGEALETLCPDRVESLAYHYWLGEVWDKACDYGQQAGDQARAVYANEEAAGYYTRALQALDQMSSDVAARRYTLLLAREKVYELQGAREAQQRDLEALDGLVEALGGNARRAEVALRQANYAAVTSDYPAAIAAAQVAVVMAQTSKLPKIDVACLQSAGYLQWGRALFYLGDYAEAGVQLEQALALARSARSHQTEADSLRNLGNVCLPQGDYALARGYFEQALRIYREIGARRGESALLANLGAAHYHLGDYIEAMACYEQALDIFREVGDKRSELWGLCNLGLLLHHLGDDEEACRHTRQALQAAQELDERDIQGYALTYLGHAVMGLGRLAEAADAYQRAYDLRQALGQINLSMEPLAGLARVALAQDDLAQAEALVAKIPLVDANAMHGIGEVFWVYQTCHCVFAAAQDPRAQDVLVTACALLQERAAKIPGEETRHSFLENVVTHRQLAAACQAMEAGPSRRQVRVRLPLASAPTGRPLREDEWMQVVWTVDAAEDAEVSRKADRRRCRLLRLLGEAAAQSAAPTVKDLASALGVNERTVRRDLAALREAGHQVRTRGTRLDG
jgi:DNA-binding SARP family transcriptional activator/predicted ATPase